MPYIAVQLPTIQANKCTQLY